MTPAELNRCIAKKVFKQTCKPFVNPMGNKIMHWRNAKNEYIGCGPEPPGNWSRELMQAMPLLNGRHWTVHTCDDGYRCEIWKAPESGEDLIGEGVAFKLSEAICLAVLQSTEKP